MLVPAASLLHQPCPSLLTRLTTAATLVSSLPDLLQRSPPPPFHVLPPCPLVRLVLTSTKKLCLSCVQTLEGWKMRLIRGAGLTAGLQGRQAQAEHLGH